MALAPAGGLTITRCGQAEAHNPIPRALANIDEYEDRIKRSPLDILAREVV